MDFLKFPIFNLKIIISPVKNCQLVNCWQILSRLRHWVSFDSMWKQIQQEQRKNKYYENSAISTKKIGLLSFVVIDTESSECSIEFASSETIEETHNTIFADKRLKMLMEAADISEGSMFQIKMIIWV